MSLEGTLQVNEFKANNNNNDGYDNGHHYFAICRACFWTATILRTKRITNNNKLIILILGSFPVRSALIA